MTKPIIIQTDCFRNSLPDSFLFCKQFVQINQLLFVPNMNLKPYIVSAYYKQINFFPILSTILVLYYK